VTISYKALVCKLLFKLIMTRDNVVDIILGDQISRKLEDRKRDLSILLLGHYMPPKVLKKLEKFRNFLRNNGYPNVKLVKDIPDDRLFSTDDDEHFVLKSKFNMEIADIILFVFFKDGEKTGPEIELAHLCDVLRHRCWRCVIFCEKSYTKRVSSMLKGNIKISMIRTRSFNDNNDKQLYDAALAALTEFSIKQYRQLKSNL
jgi:hypothetical protein